MKIRPYRAADEAAVIALWKACGLTRPQNDPLKDIARKLRVNPELFLVAEQGGKIVGTVMAGYEGHRGWINYLGVAPELQRGGLGRQLMDEAEHLLRAAGCPKINLQVRPDNRAAIAFYERVGFAVEGAISMGKRLERDGL
ncbi:MAG TPA: GNAT family acetyltransferase [Candidatus Didemnitutus sp.]|nr:GNAT family acetyltransferase [Candidatus Didemnitutus sp.]